MSKITSRQREVVLLVARGLSNEEIAGLLKISARTAKAHVDTLREKLGVSKKREIPLAYWTLTGENPYPH